MERFSSVPLTDVGCDFEKRKDNLTCSEKINQLIVVAYTLD